MFSIFPLVFEGFREGFAHMLMLLFGLVLMVSLGVTVYHVIQGEKDSAKKMFKWIFMGAVGMILIYVIGYKI